MSEYFTIRDVELNDYPSLAKMTVELNKIENAITGDRLTDLSSAENHITYLMNCLEEQGGFTLVAEVSGKPVGFLVAFHENEEGHYIVPEARRYGYISDLYVDGTFRRKGIARALLEDAEQRLKANGYNKLEISALALNQVAISTYESMGYKAASLLFSKNI